VADLQTEDRHEALLVLGLDVRDDLDVRLQRRGAQLRAEPLVDSGIPAELDISISTRTAWSSPAPIRTSSIAWPTASGCSCAGRRRCSPSRRARTCRDRRSAMFSTIWMWTHEWSDMFSRSALTAAACHQP
jgi:hypothetical protein